MPHEETRKIIRVGNSLAITIPCAWARYFKLKEKDSVRIISNGKITIEKIGEEPFQAPSTLSA
ncbi:MAG: AbrB/MazE/SpoVT family DNA-binding domain-containing protein [Candidatus Bathyarchaeia archaeon]|jgi:antitoxin component of MazEF toxin-antitoxin module